MHNILYTLYIYIQQYIHIILWVLGHPIESENEFECMFVTVKSCWYSKKVEENEREFGLHRVDAVDQILTPSAWATQLSPSPAPACILCADWRCSKVRISSCFFKSPTILSFFTVKYNAVEKNNILFIDKFSTYKIKVILVCSTILYYTSMSLSNNSFILSDQTQHERWLISGKSKKKYSYVILECYNMVKSQEVLQKVKIHFLSRSWYVSCMIC